MAFGTVRPMSAQSEPFEVGQKVHLLVVTGQLSTKRFEIVKVWRYPTTYRYLLDTGYVADHSEVRATSVEDPATAAPTAKPAAPPVEEAEPEP